MATKKTSQSSRGRKSSSGRRSSSKSRAENSSLDLRRFNNTDFQKIMKRIKANPVALYLAGGVSAVFLSRFLFRYYRNHPEIKDFILENFDSVESALKEYRSGNRSEDQELAESRH